jgi:hypothetical protein
MIHRRKYPSMNSPNEDLKDLDTNLCYFAKNQGNSISKVQAKLSRKYPLISLQSEPKDFKTGSLSSRSSLNSNENVALAFGTRILEPQKSEATLPSRPYYNEETAT